MVSLRGKRETRVNGNEPQGTMERSVISFPPSFARKFSSRERDVWVQGRGSTITRQKFPENSFISYLLFSEDFWKAHATQKEQNFLTKTCLNYIPSLLTRSLDLLCITLRPVSLLCTNTLQNKCSIAIGIK